MKRDEEEDEEEGVVGEKEGVNHWSLLRLTNKAAVSALKGVVRRKFHSLSFPFWGAKG